MRKLAGLLCVMVLLGVWSGAGAAPSGAAKEARDFARELKRAERRHLGRTGSPAEFSSAAAVLVSEYWDAVDALRADASEPDADEFATHRDEVLLEQLQDRPPPAWFTRRLALTPDLLQTDPKAELPNGGRNSCGPVAFSNALAALAGAGRPELLPAGADRMACQMDVARTFASAEHMDTE